MKARITHNSIRLRLSRDDISRLGRTLPVETACEFPNGGILSFELCVDSEIDNMRADPDGVRIRILLPGAWIKGWLDDDREGFAASLDLESGNTLELQVEKDFKCLHRDTDPSFGSFPHPKEK
jgi:Family of unknown function (DUF7009)